MGGKIQNGTQYFKREQTEHWTTAEQETDSNK